MNLSSFLWSVGDLLRAKVKKHERTYFNADPFLRRAAEASFYDTSPVDLNGVPARL
jgi:hypothetical protein